MSVDLEEEKFEYDGQLVFNGIHLTDVDDESVNPDTIVDRLPSFSQGTADDPGSGYKQIRVSKLLANGQTIDDGLKEVATNLSSFRYLYEDWYESEADVDGERRVVKIPRVNDVDIYWKYPDYMFFRGQQTDSDQTEEDIKKELRGRTNLDTVTFEPDFLLWILYKYRNDDSLSSNLEARLLTECETTGPEDNYGGRNEVGDSADICKSVPLLDALLRQKDLTMLEGNFQVHTNHVGAKIGSRGRVHVKASRGDVKTSNQLRRMALSLQFLEEFTELYKDWRDNMSPKDKYPPDSFFEEIRDECDTQGNRIIYSIKPVLDEYRQKRNSGP